MTYNVTQQQVPDLTGEATERLGFGPLEVNVIFTDAPATRAAFEAAIPRFPFRLFTEEVLSRLVSRFEQNSLDIHART